MEWLLVSIFRRKEVKKRRHGIELNFGAQNRLTKVNLMGEKYLHNRIDYTWMTLLAHLDNFHKSVQNGPILIISSPLLH